MRKNFILQPLFQSAELFMRKWIRVRIREAQKHTDPTDPEHWQKGGI